MTYLTFREFIENLKSRGYSNAALLDFIKNLPDEQIILARPLWEWNNILDTYLLARNYAGPEGNKVP